jgi:hypothetical protein
MTLLEERCYLERDRWVLFESIMPPSPSLIIARYRCLTYSLTRRRGKFRLGDTTWYGEGFLFGES